MEATNESLADGLPRRAAGVTRGARSIAGWVLPLLVGLGAPSLVSAQILQQVRTENVQVVYPGPAFAYLLPHVAASAENALRFHRELYNYRPSEPVTLFLEDFSDFGHGGANTVPVNFVNLGVAPFNYVYETTPAIDRMYWMANHEMAHIVHMDQGADRDLTFRRLFGGKVEPEAEQPLSIFYNYLTTPRWNAPRWYHEGAAVFLETWMAGGLGRTIGAYDEMVFRTMVRDDAHFYDVVGLESEGTAADFQVGVNSYLYGTRFISYLAHRYGPEKVIQWTARQPGSRPHFAAQFRHVYGLPLADTWSEWIEAERVWQRSNLEAIRTEPVAELRPLTASALGSVSRPYLDRERNRLYVAVRTLGQLAHLAALDLETGELERLLPLQGAALFYVTSLAFDAEGQRLFFTTKNYGWRDIHELDLETGTVRTLLHEARVGDLVFDRSDRSLWGVRHFNGISTVVRIPEPYTKWEQMHSWPYGQDVYDLDVSPDGKWMSAALAEVSGRQSLVLLDLERLRSGELALETLYDFETSSPANFVFTPDGSALVGTSYYSGVSNIYRYELEQRDIFILTNAETGLFRPLPLEGDRLLAFHYTGQGFVPVETTARPLDRVGAIRFLGTAIANEHPLVREWHAGSPAALASEELRHAGRPYSTVRNLKLRTFYPIVEGYKDSVAAGMRFDFSDGLDLTNLALTLSYSPDEDLESSERLHFDAKLRHWNWEIGGWYNAADFYDLFGPTKTSRRGYSLGFDWTKVLHFDDPEKLTFKSSLRGYGDLDSLPSFQNVEVTERKLIQARVALEHELLWKALGAVEAGKGSLWGVEALVNVTESQTSPSLSGRYDLGFPLALDHSSVWLRTAAGHSFGERGDPFAQFFFGGFGNNYVDYRNEKRYRSWHSFPGLELDEVGGRNYAKATLEWNLPPVRFRSAGSPSFYLNWARPALFASGLATDLDRSELRRELLAIGAQLDFKLVLFSNLSSMLSIGWGVALEDGRGPSDEIMLSLKIL
ncbi:MAG TPA: hypothetical protein VNB06_18790 [Thermoanaerobaculia bacterium]|nr:hypothetical protein [Thermoanaerobaculia bacterium]